MGIVIAIIFLLIELIFLIMLASRIKRYKSFTIKDTIIYPLLLITTLLLLFLVRLLYVDVDFLHNVKDSFNDALGIIKLSFNNEIIATLKENNIPLLIAYYGSYFISFAALFSLTIYLFIITFRNFSRLLSVVFSGKEIILVFGYNDDAKKVIKNFKDKKVKMIFVLDSSQINKHVEEKTFLDKHGVGYIAAPYKEKEDYLPAIKKVTRLKSKKHTIITFFSDDKANDEFSTEAIKFLINNKRGNVYFIMNVDSVQESFIQAKVYSSETNTDITNGHFRTYNKYDLNSYIFNQKHSFAKHIRNLETKDIKFINDDCTISNCDIHAYFLGFGKVNQALLRDVLVNNQFVGKEEVEKGKYVLKKKNILVDIYDEKMKFSSIELANGLFKYKKECFNQDNYLELPEDYVSNVNIHFNTNVESSCFINTIYDDIKKRIKNTGKHQINFFFVSLKGDMYNSYITDSISNSIDAIDGCNNVYFVRKEEVNEFDKPKDNVYYIGSEDVVFSHKNILLDGIYDSAKLQFYTYSNYGDVDPEVLKEKWNNLSLLKKKANLYAVNGLFFKRDLLDVNESNFEEKYNPHKLSPADGEEIDRLVLPKDHFDPIDVLAFSEHERWNAFELAYGVLPMKVSTFKEMNKGNKGRVINQTKDGNYHLCITSAKGLVDYYNLLRKSGFSEDANVVKYDYDIMNNYIKHQAILKK